MSTPDAFPPVKGAVADFFRRFYKVSDTPDAHDEYPKFFVEDADFTMASKKAKGHSDILAIREGMWAVVQSRHHVVTQLFPSDLGSDENSPRELMLRGTVQYVFKDGGEGGKEWGAYAKLVKDEGGEWKFADYQVYLDTAK